MEDVFRIYRRGQIPIHLAARYFHRPLAFLLHRLLLLNEEQPYSAGLRFFVRVPCWTNSARTIRSALRLHADLTALLTAAHFEVLDKIETHFIRFSSARHSHRAGCYA